MDAAAALEVAATRAGVSVSRYARELIEEGLRTGGLLAPVEPPEDWRRLVALAKARGTTTALLVDAIADGSRVRTAQPPGVDAEAALVAHLLDTARALSAEERPGMRAGEIRVDALVSRAGLRGEDAVRWARRALRDAGWANVAARPVGGGPTRRVWRAPNEP